MKSKLFSSNAMFKEGSIRLDPIKRDLEALLSIKKDKTPLFINAVNEMLGTEVAEHDPIATAVLPQLGIDRSTFDHACHVAGWMASEFFPGGVARADTPSVIVEDLLELKLIAPGQMARAIELVQAIQSLAKEQLPVELEKERELHRGAPKVLGVETAMFFRNIFH